MYNTIAAEESGTPAVALCNKDFVMDARSASSGKGMPRIRIVSESVPCECSVTEEIEEEVAAVVDDIIDALIKPLSTEEASPSKPAENTSRIVFKGSLREVNDFFYKRGWTDGLPIIPPTEEAVAEMLEGTDLPPNHVVAKFIPRMGKATIEKIAINAVMAGALPTYMPVLIASVEALMDPKGAFGTFEVSTGSWSPFWVINGPLRHDLNINCGSGALSPGDIANASIGRAVGLIVKNIGGARKAVEDMGVLGNPGKYSMVLGENEEESPWEPLHVERGFNKEDSTITVFFPNTYIQAACYGTDARGLMNTLAYNIEPGRGRESLTCFLIIPGHAKTLFREGLTKEDVLKYIMENSTVPFYRYNVGWRLLNEGKTPDQIPLNMPLYPDEPIRLISDIKNTMIVVAGGPGSFMGSLRSAGGMFRNSFVTKKIELPGNWDKLVKKYKGMKPTYAMY